MNDFTIIYPTSNRENGDFEKKIRDKILAVSGDIPIVSVSQKPIDFGHNICVGDVGASNFNYFRQVQIACEFAKTTFVIEAEADCLYSPSYFKFVPPRSDICYRNSNIRILKRTGGFYKKTCSAFSQIVGREYYLSILKEIFVGKPEWDEQSKKRPGEPWASWELFQTEEPCISIKTGNGLRKDTQLINYDSEPSIPYWGSAEDLRKELLMQ